MPTGLPSNFVLLYRRLLTANVQVGLPGKACSIAISISNEDLCRLVGFGSILALSNDAADRTIAYEIATRAVLTRSKETLCFVHAAELILARLGNFPGRDLLLQRYRHEARDGVPRPGYLELEALAREMENTETGAGGQSIVCTDFQCNVLQAFSEARSVSVSAPTSAGKSFVLSLEVIRRLQARRYASIIYLVPTRALIRQVMLTLRGDLIEAGMPRVALRSIPIPIQQRLSSSGVVYVLTQERLLSLLHSEDTVPVSQRQMNVTMLIVDEAQGIGDGARGILLHTAIDTLRLRFPEVEMIFASPLAKNPEYLLELFHRDDGRPFLEQHSPVSQNIIVVGRARDDQTRTAFRLLENGAWINLGERDLGFSLSSTGVLLRRGKFAQAIARKDSCCLVYANGARDAEKLAATLAERLSAPSKLDSEVSEFIRFLVEHIHKQYGLIAVLRKGVGFHYSNMPSSVRSGVEELCKNNKLRFLCCTSTLLQGVNLPAKDIVLENPKRGIGKPMSRPDFLNLAGRAGRLRREFHGNVWCLRPDIWEEASFSGEPLQQIESALAKVLRDGGASIRQALDDPSELDDPDMSIAALSRIYTEFVLQGRRLEDSSYRTLLNQESLKLTMERLEGIHITLPPAVLNRNSGILPTRLERLYRVLSTEHEVRNLMPISPFQLGTNARLRKIFEHVEQWLQEDKTQRFRYYAMLASRWIHNTPLRRIISDTIAYRQRRDGSVNIRDTVYELISDLEKVIRYRFVKHLRAYNDVLAVVLRDRKMNAEAESLVPLHLFLECGASEPVVLSLLSLGLSRVVALLLVDCIPFPANATPEACLRSLRRANLARLGLSAYCRKEVETLVRQS